MDDLMNFIADLIYTNSSESPFGQLKYKIAHVEQIGHVV